MSRSGSAALLASSIALAAVFGACSDDEGPETPPACDAAAGECEEEALAPYEGEELSGGDTTVFDVGKDAFARPARNLTPPERDEFSLGDHFFNRGWVMAPASAEGNDGLGPTFNATSCSACHSHDGRGKPPDDNDDRRSFGMLVRLSVPGTDAHGGPAPEPIYGDQLQNDAIFGLEPEGRVEIAWEETPGAYGDGEAYSLRRPVITIVDLAYGPMAGDVMTSVRVGQATFGLGLIEAIGEDDILANEDADDANGDGISGRANRVWDAASQSTRLGRLGWKANQPGVAQQVQGAFLGDMGITSPLFRTQNCTEAQLDCLAAPHGGDPEVDESKTRRIVFYSHTLAVPARRDVGAPQVLAGRTLFEESGCASCHVQSFRTGTLEGYAMLSDQLIWPYTDLLLHDLGDGLADGRPDYLADGREWRTAPLWGIGLTQAVSKHTMFLHDGRARGLAEAILWHGGEAEPAREAFRTMPRADRDALLAFLQSL
jgi:CxxC motif-containing protein (DUF1111 family)